MIYKRMCHLSNFGIEIESRFPFFIANGIDDCKIAVEFLRFTVNALLLATCKAALALRRRGGDSVELPILLEIIFDRIELCCALIKSNAPRELNALRFVPADVRSDDFPVSLVTFWKSDWCLERGVGSVCEFFFTLLSV